MSQTDKMLSRKENGVGYVIFNNPERHNAASLDMWKAFVAILNGFASDPEIRVVVVTGAGGKAFVSGADISKFGEERSSEDAVKIYNEAVELGYATVHTFPKPTIAMVRGPAAGAGMSMAIACDFRYASETAFFTSAFSRIGASGDLGCAYYLQQLVGPTKARELLMLSDKVTADEALRIGLVSKVVKDEELLAETMAFARRLADGPPIALRYIKANLVAAEGFNMDAYLDQEARNIIRCFQTEDSKEAIAAFQEKRAPVFRGV